MNTKRFLVSAFAVLLLFSTMFASFTINSTTSFASGGSSATGVNVIYHSQSDIRNYIKEHIFDINENITYSREPDMTAPYTDAGKLSDYSLQKGLNALNSMRYIAGLPSVTLNNDLNELCQQGAYVSALNHTLSHNPTKPDDISDEIFANGYQACGSSNLSSGCTNLAYSVISFMNDSDSSNIDRLGHRRWCLNPNMGQTGFGQVSVYQTMYAFDTSSNCTSSGVCWPAQNMPLDYFSNNQAWSYSLGKSISNINNVKVTLTRNSDKKVWNFSASSADGYFNINNAQYGKSGCVIFRPSNITYSNNDSFTVNISGLDTNVNYTVRFFSLSPEIVKNASAKGAPNSVTLSWDKVSDADHYQIEMYKDDKRIIAGTTTLTSYTVTDLAPDKYYTFYIYAYNDVFGSLPCRITAETKYAETIYINYQSYSSTSHSVKLSWGSSKQADYYNVYVLENGNYKFVGKTNDTNYEIDNLSADTDYTFQISPVKSDANVKPSSINCKTKKLETISLKNYTVGTTDIKIEWEKFNDSRSYEIYVKQNGIETLVGKTADNSFYINNLSPNTYYNFEIYSIYNSERSKPFDLFFTTDKQIISSSSKPGSSSSSSKPESSSSSSKPGSSSSSSKPGSSSNSSKPESTSSSSKPENSSKPSSVSSSTTSTPIMSQESSSSTSTIPIISDEPIESSNPIELNGSSMTNQSQSNGTSSNSSDSTTISGNNTLIYIVIISAAAAVIAAAIAVIVVAKKSTKK